MFSVRTTLECQLWQPASEGLFLGYISSFYRTDDRLFAFGYSDIFYSTDDGDSWVRINNKVISIDPYTYKTVYGKQIALLKTSWPRRIMYSPDEGDTWMDYPATNIDRVSAFEIDPAYAYFVCRDTIEDNNRLIRFSLESLIYDTVYTSELIKQATDVMPFNGKVFLSNSQTGVIVSEDNCLTWENANKDLNWATSSRLIPSNGKMYFFSDSGFYKYIDSEARWELMTDSSLVLNSSKINVTDKYLYVMTDKPYKLNHDGSIVDSLVIYRENGDWAYTISADNDFVHIGTNGFGIYRSPNDGIEWEIHNAGLNNACMNDLISLSKNLAGHDAFLTIYKSSNLGDTWEKDLQQRFVRTLYGYNGLGFYGTSSFGLWSIDSTFAKKEILPHFGQQIDQIQITKDAFIIVSRYDVFRNLGDGADWDKSVSPPVPVSQLCSIDTVTFALSKNELYTSTDLGLTWGKITPAFDNEPRQPLDFSTIANHGNLLYLAGPRSGIYKSSDLGATWKDISGSLGPLYTNNNRIFMEFFGEYVFIASADGVFTGKNDGQKWVKVSSGIPVDNEMGYINSIRIIDDKIFVSVCKNNIYLANVIDLILFAGFDDAIKKGDGLIDFYPNPVNDILTVTSNTQGRIDAQIHIKDITGRIALTYQTILDPSIPIELETSAIVNGIYIVEIQFDRITEYKLIYIE
jgi:photosystem II stability/assembly factor-like uncharacterized protein